MKTKQFTQELTDELEDNILSYWMQYATDPKGGFHGRILHDNTVVPDSPKGSVLNARILWTFSAAYNQLGNKAYLTTATRAYDYIVNHFIDKEYGGVYWKLDADGKPLETKKQIYALAFTIYAMVEYYIASGNSEALDWAIELYYDIENHSFDKEKNGYFEAYTREWKPIEDLRLSAKDANEAKTNNTHLHVLEAYTRLLAVWKTESLQQQLENLTTIFLEKIVNKSNSHFNLFFDEDWKLKSSLMSYGHDIEGAWLLLEAARETANPDLIAEAEILAVKIADVTLAEGAAPDGSLYYEGERDGSIDKDRHWWVQAEGMVGFVNAYQLTYDVKYLDAAVKVWEYIKKYLICPSGEWYWSVDDTYIVNTKDDKVGFWKCPYHNARACIEITKRI